MDINKIAKTYDPESFEEKWYEKWETEKKFETNCNKNKDPYVIMMPPPNVTGVLHMGHALQDSIQDTLIRYKRMKGFESLWQPGTDHAGIATQNVVEKRLKKEGISRHELGREKFIEKVWEWKNEHGNIISKQKRKLGDSADWKKERFTLDEGLSKAVKEAFVTLYEKGLIYKGKYIVNWCPRCHTAISNEEVEHKDKSGKLWHIKYPIKNSKEYLIVATTRPETMLGDTAIAINPTDERYFHLKGKTCILPIVNREIPIIFDNYVDKSFGTGCVKVTPAHDPNDFNMGERHNLKKIIVIDTKAIMNENATEKYCGLDRYECRKQLIKDLENSDLIEKIEDYNNKVGECSRCSTVIEPYLSDQWFVKMKPLAEPAMNAVKNGEIKIYPKRWEKVYLEWLSGIRDWCISRQLWWGHRIPVYYCEDCKNIMVKRETPKKCEKCSSTKIKQDNDVLDTWFSSWLWPFSTLGWPEKTKELDYFYPTDVLVSGYDIIYFWISRMVMAGLEFTGKIPFKHMFLTGLIKDKLGRRMSKSLGNGIDPLDMIKKYGADAVRFSLIYLCTEGQDINLDPARFEMGRNFANKIWNAFRFCSNYFEEENYAPLKKEELVNFEDRWILSRLNNVIKNVTNLWNEYKMSAGLYEIYQFIWKDLCDWYIEIVKSRFSENNDDSKKIARRVLFQVFNDSMKILHPVMPFITEEIKSLLTSNNNFLMCDSYPELNRELIDNEADKFMEKFREVVSVIRNARSEMNISPGEKLEVIASFEENDTSKNIFNSEKNICSLARLKSFKKGNKENQKVLSTVCSLGEMFIVLDNVDLSQEKQRLEKEKQKIEKTLKTKKNKLENKNFIEKAKPEIVNSTKKEVNDLESKISIIIEKIKELEV